MGDGGVGKEIGRSEEVAGPASSRPQTDEQFGKTIQSQQVPGWGEYYLNYKVGPTARPRAHLRVVGESQRGGRRARVRMRGQQSPTRLTC